MTALIIIVLILALLGILGAVVKGLLWLTAIALLLIAAAIAYGWIRYKMRGSGNSGGANHTAP